MPASVSPNGAQLAEMAHMVDEGKIKPVIDRRFQLAEVNDTLAYVAKGRARGKVVLAI